MRKLTIVFLAAMIFLTATSAKAASAHSIRASGQRVEADPYALINEVNALRAANGLPAYSIDSILMLVAQQHAQYMAANGVTHLGAGGSSPWQRGLAAGYPLAGDLLQGGFYSENITAGNNKSIQDAVASWQGDAPHLNTMLSPNLTEIGAGVVVVGDYVYYVIDCAQPTNSGRQQVYTPVPGGLPAAGSTAAAAALVVNTIVAATPLQDGRIIHVVRPGETLWLIAVSYGVKIVDLRKLNHLAEGQSIFPGNKLFIGQGSTPTAIPPKATATIQPIMTSISSPTANPSPTPTLTPLPVAPVSLNSSMVVLGVIVAAALLLAAVFVRAERRIY